MIIRGRICLGRLHDEMACIEASEEIRETDSRILLI